MNYMSFVTVIVYMLNATGSKFLSLFIDFYGMLIY